MEVLAGPYQMMNTCGREYYRGTPSRDVDGCSKPIGYDHGEDHSMDAMPVHRGPRSFAKGQGLHHTNLPQHHGMALALQDQSAATTSR